MKPLLLVLGLGLVLGQQYASFLEHFCPTPGGYWDSFGCHDQEVILFLFESEHHADSVGFGCHVASQPTYYPPLSVVSIHEKEYPGLAIGKSWWYLQGAVRRIALNPKNATGRLGATNSQPTLTEDADMTDTDRYSKSTTNLTDMLAAWREMHHAIIPVRELFGDGACIFECLIVALAEGRTEDLSDELDDYTRASPEVFRRDLNNCIMKARQAMPEIMESWDRFQKVMGGT